MLQLPHDDLDDAFFQAIRKGDVGCRSLDCAHAKVMRSV